MKNNRIEPVPVISLFCGPGGMDIGFRRSGFMPVLALDNKQAAIETYNWNDRRKVAHQCDLSQLTGDELVGMVEDISSRQMPRGVIGGPPCQSFSLGNVRKKRHDPRARLALTFARLVNALNKEFGIDFFVFENVVGLRTARHKNRFKAIQGELRDAGFNLFVQELDAGDFGVPQRRLRLLIVGINRDKYPWVRFQFPTSSGSAPTVGESIGGLPRPAFFRRGLTLREIPSHPNHWTMNPKSIKFRNGIRGNGRSFKRLVWDKPSLTVAYGNREVHIHPEGDRRLSVYEAMLLQGFPRTYEFRGSLSDQISQVSDAVPPPLAEAVAKKIHKTVYSSITESQRKLLRWFEKSQRPFPWRRTSDPFKVLIAEKLLQQTAATEGVVKAFRGLVKRFPNWERLAKAPQMELKRIVTPLGLAYRSNELIRLAQNVVRHHKGALPKDFQSLKGLPGVGDYCARAVLSFAFGQPIAIVDTNVARFLVRYFGLKLRLSQNPARDRRLHRIADALVPPNAARDFNLAVLDLCAAHCKARQPQCRNCPVRSGCAYWNANKK